MSEKVAFNLENVRQGARALTASVKNRSRILRHDVTGVDEFDDQVAIFETAVAHHRNFVFEHTPEIAKSLLQVARDFEALDQKQADAIKAKR